MSLQDIIIKILFFFAVFYGAIAITSFVSKKLNLAEKAKEKEDKNEEEEEGERKKFCVNPIE